MDGGGGRMTRKGKRRDPASVQYCRSSHGFNRHRFEIANVSEQQSPELSIAPWGQILAIEMVARRRRWIDGTQRRDVPR